MTLNRDYLPAIGLGVTQIMGYGTLMYAHAVLLPHMAADLGLSLSQIFGVLSAGLLFGGLVSPFSGHLTDRFGGRPVMVGGSVVAGLALIAMSYVTTWQQLFVTILVAEGAGMFVLYNVAFAAVARLNLSVPAQRSISIITLFGGVASTIFWPLTLALFNAHGWQTTWVILGVAYLIVCLPIHMVALNGPERAAATASKAQASGWPELQGAARKRRTLWMVISFIFSGYLMGAVMVLWVTNVQDLGHTAAMAALAGAVIGPFKTVGRFFEMLITRNMHPLSTYLLALSLQLGGFAVILSVGFTVSEILIAAAIYGMGDGIKTIVRGTLPLALFGHKGFGARLGWIASLSMAVNATAPFVFAWLTQVYGGWWSFAVMALCVAVAFLAYLKIEDPRRTPAYDPA
ncbi:MAG: MFS transporter [Pseudomonadota bacterium]